MFLLETNRSKADTSRRSPTPYWNYEDIGIFVFILTLINLLIRVAVRLYVLRSSDLASSRLVIQVPLIVLLATNLYAILKFRYRRPVLGPLGWVLPARFYVALAILGGVTVGLSITYFMCLSGQVLPAISTKEFMVLGFLLGPILEETVFRGYLLPLLRCTLGPVLSVLATATLFAAFHSPRDLIHWIWFIATGVAYGSLRLSSATTTAAGLMHAACNFGLFFASKCIV